MVTLTYKECYELLEGEKFMKAVNYNGYIYTDMNFHWDALSRCTKDWDDIDESKLMFGFVWDGVFICAQDYRN